MSLPRVRRAIVVLDVVESVRLMEDAEDDTIERWCRFVDEVRLEVLPVHRGRLVKSLGDGMLLEFPTALEAVHAALEARARIASCNLGRTAEAAVRLRIGIHAAEIVVEDLDVFGTGVNLAARLAALGGPDEIILSPQARDEVVPDLDVDIEDLGEVYLKHLREPQRAFRAGPAGQRSPLWSGQAAGGSERLVIAVIPFPVSGASQDQYLLGEVLADDLIARLSQLQQLQVISRLSTTVFRDRAFDLEHVAATLGCDYLVHGSCFTSGDRFRVRAQLVACRTQEVLWAEGLDGSVQAALGGTSPVIEAAAEHICHALLECEIHRALTSPLPTLESYTIMLGAVALMHRLGRDEFERAHEMLTYLIERHPRATAPRAWLGKWHVLRVAQGWSPAPGRDANVARGVIGRALDLNPEHSLALAIDGLVCAYISKDLEAAGQRYDMALRINPSESLAWLFKSALHAYEERGTDAVNCAHRARRLSPLDPMQYFYDNFTSTALLAAGDYEGAKTYGLRSARANRTHGPTLRVLAIAQALSGDLDDARITVSRLLHQEPSFTLTEFRLRYPGAQASYMPTYLDALHAAGVPA